MKTATISTDGVYRYLLSRTWEPSAEPCGWIMLNPSTADADIDDPTIRRCMGFARSWGYGGIVVANLYAYRATNPDDLIDAAGAGVDPVGSGNVDAILALFDTCRVVVCAWGSSFVTKRGWRLPRLDVEGMALRYDDRALFCLGRTKTGQPRHPLYVAGNQELVVMA